MKPSFGQISKAMMEIMNNAKRVRSSKKAEKWFLESFLPGGVNHCFYEEILNDKDLMRKKKRRS